MTNEAIRTAINEAGVNHYHVAAEMGVNPYTFCRWLQIEQPDEKKTKILEAVKRAADRKAKGEAVQKQPRMK